MTTERYHTCEHCRDEYIFTGSSYGRPLPELNDPRWCPECLSVIRAALSTVPRKFEDVWLPTVEVTLAQLLEWEATAERVASQRITSDGIVFPVARRVSTPLFDRGTGETDSSGFVRGRGPGPNEGRHYQYRFWPGREDEAVLQVRMTRDLRTRALTYASRAH